MVENSDNAPGKRPGIGVHSGNVMTVEGALPTSEMGITLMHEHILLDGKKSWKYPHQPELQEIADQPVAIENLGELRMNPYASRDNVSLNDSQLTLSELDRFKVLGGQTIVDCTNIGMGRDPAALARISEKSALNIVMGSGFYLGHTHPGWLKTMGLDALTEFIVNDVGGGRQQPEIIAGIIGEVGISKDFTAEEHKSLRASARAARVTGVPLSIHLPGWEHLAHEVLDIVEDEGADIRHTVLCHMNPSHDDLAYQSALAARGAFLEYDMIGMNYYFADQDAQSPSDEQSAKAIIALIDMGHADRLLISHDVFLKMMLTMYGGHGYGFILRHFVPRLKRMGVGRAVINQLLVDNPISVFAAAD